MSMQYSPLGKVRAFVIICCLVLIVGIIAYAFLTDNNSEILEREKIEEKIESLHNQDLGYTYISSYVKKYGIGNLNSYKINVIENQLEIDFYKPLPAEYDIAEDVCLLYLEHFYDEVDKSDKEAVTDAVIKCLFASLGDPYAYYRTAEEFAEYLASLEGSETFGGIGISVDSTTLEVIIVYIDSPADKAGIRPGDFIYGVGEKTIDNSSPDEVVDLIKGEVGAEVTVTVRRGEELIDFTMTRELISERSVTYEIDEDKVGYIYIMQFLATTAEQFKEAVDYCVDNGAVALVIDVRYNPGGLLSSVTDVIDYVIPDASGRMIATHNQGGIDYTYYTEDGHGVDIPIAVICNEHTASAGELFTAAMRDFGDMSVIKSVVVGTTTYGKGVVQTSYTLFDNSGITYTVGYYNPPCDINFDGIGVAPDYEVEETTEYDRPFEEAKARVLELVYTNSGTVGILNKAA